MLSVEVKSSTQESTPCATLSKRYHSSAVAVDHENNSELGPTQNYDPRDSDCDTSCASSLAECGDDHMKDGEQGEGGEG